MNNLNELSKEQIRALRLRLGTSQEQFARLLGVSFATVNRWEAGKVHPSQLAQKSLHQLEEETNDRKFESEN